MRTTIRRYVKGSVQNSPEKTYKVEMKTRKTDEQIIAEELVKAEREKKEKELLEAQLKLPPSKRSEELMRKYNLSVVTDNTLIDNYNTNTGELTSYEIYYPEDVAVKELRPSNHLVAIEGLTDSNFDEFNFYFHVSINESTPGTFNYKIDGMDTYVDKEYKLLPKGDFDLYKALYFYKMKDKGYEDQILKVFKKFGITHVDTKSIFDEDSPIDLKIRGLGLMVTYTTRSIPTKPVEEELTNKKLPKHIKEFLKDERDLGENVPFKIEGRSEPVFLNLDLLYEDIFIGNQYTAATKKNISEGRLIVSPNSYAVIGALYGSSIRKAKLYQEIASSNLEFYNDKTKEMVTNKTVKNFLYHLAKKT